MDGEMKIFGTDEREDIAAGAAIDLPTSSLNNKTGTITSSTFNTGMVV
jgi:hypothetical protein